MVKMLPPNAGGGSSILSCGANIPHTSLSKTQNLKQKQFCNKFSNNLKKLVHIKILHISKKKFNV